MPEDNMGGSYAINGAGEKVLVSRTDGMPEPQPTHGSTGVSPVPEQEFYSPAGVSEAPALVPGKKTKPAAAQSVAPAADIENPTGGNQ